MTPDPDQRIAEILRRGAPAPTTLDPARREAILASARQAWFQSRSQRRRSAWVAAAAACLAAGVAGWAIRSMAEPATAPRSMREDVAWTGSVRPAEAAAEAGTYPVAAAPPPMAPMAPSAPASAKVEHEVMAKRGGTFGDLGVSGGAGGGTAQAPAAPPMAAAEAPGEKMNEELRHEPSKQDAIVAADAQQQTVVASTESRAGDLRERRALAAADRPAAEADRDKDGAAPAGGTVGNAVAADDKPSRVQPAAKAMKPAAMPVAAAAAAGPGARAEPPIQVADDAPQRNRQLAAASVLRALRSGAIPAADRAGAATAALELLAGIAHPSADALRQALRDELARR